MAARLALSPLPTDASSTVTQVPIFCPIMMGTAVEKGTMPVEASACSIPTEAEDDWMSAVTSAPASIPVGRESQRMKSARKSALSDSGSSACSIMPMPKNSRPNPSGSSARAFAPLRSPPSR